MAFGSEQWMYASGGFYPYEIDQSLRFNRPDSTYLTRTPSLASNRKTWTWSGWVKRSDIVSQQSIFVAGRNVVGVQSTGWSIVPNGELQMYTATVGVSNEGFMKSEAVFRDPSAWYHLVLVIDSTQANQDDRVKAWVNGEAITLISQGWYVQQNYDTAVNSTLRHDIGHVDAGGVDFQGYMAEVHFIDGQSLTPSSFAETKSGVWVPKEYEGTYGTNGFYLPFDDAGFLGKDNSTVLGSDLVTNGSFDANVSDWSLNGACTTSWLSSGKMQINRTGGTGPTAYQAITCEVGATYAIRVQLNSVGSQGDLRVNEAVDSGTILNLSGTNGAIVDISGQFTATQTTHYLQFYVDNSGTSIIVDDVSVKKISSQGNDWTPNNLSVTDQVLDSPTNNFATLNPLFPDAGSFSEGNLKFTPSSGWDLSRAGNGISSGKWYFEAISFATAYVTVGITRGSGHGSTAYVGYDSNGNVYGFGYNAGGVIIGAAGTGSVTSQEIASVTSYTSGDVIGVAFDADNWTLKFYLNNTLLHTETGINADEWFFSTSGYNGAASLINFGQDSSFAGNKTAQGSTDAKGIGDFYYAPPAGYLALCTANLPDPAIDPAQDDVPADYFNTVLYTGNGSTQSITGVGFQPDWVWVKIRTQTYSHHLADTVRGANNILYSNLQNAESARNTITAFNADGFSVSTDSNNDVSTNASGETFVAWNWLAGNGTASNTNGTITSTVSANQKAGFSIVTWSGDNGVGTIGHGLTEPPEIIIRKSRTTEVAWVVTGLALGSQKYMYLNLTNAAATFASITDPTSTVFNGWGIDSNTPSMVAYCFHSVEGFSKFGSYTGNGSTDGPFVYTGFRPAFVLMKDTESTEHWQIVDSARDTYNVVDSALFPALSNIEGTNANIYRDFLSNGFKVRTSDTSQNASGRTYIYMAFAEMPFKYANAR